MNFSEIGLFKLSFINLCSDAVIREEGYKNGGCGLRKTWSVGRKTKEINGTYDMAGNVWEGRYLAGHQYNPKGKNKGTYRVIRGGGWNNNNHSYFRGTARNSNTPTDRNDYTGFRCVVSFP
ncbi:MAG: sulfatase activating formylglycine-generating enzyme [bacterium]